MVTRRGSLCRACYDAPKDALYLPCGHMVLCLKCTGKLEKKICPLCRAKIEKVQKVTSAAGRDTVDNDQASAMALGRGTILQKLNMSKWQSSSKIEAVANAVMAMCKKCQDAKAIIFSQYRNMIDLVEWRLNREMKVVKLMGFMPLGERRAVLKAFKTDPNIKVILMSLKAGGEGLNLQEASHVFLLEPWWNPAVEMQAVHRAYRIGQTRPVFATRFVTANSIEEKMYELQQKKQLVFEGTMEAKQTSLNKLAEEDFRFLFKA